MERTGCVQRYTAHTIDGVEGGRRVSSSLKHSPKIQRTIRSGLTLQGEPARHTGHCIERRAPGAIRLVQGRRGLVRAGNPYPRVDLDMLAKCAGRIGVNNEFQLAV